MAMKPVVTGMKNDYFSFFSVDGSKQATYADSVTVSVYFKGTLYHITPRADRGSIGGASPGGPADVACRPVAGRAVGA